MGLGSRGWGRGWCIGRVGAGRRWRLGPRFSCLPRRSFPLSGLPASSQQKFTSLLLSDPPPFFVLLSDPLTFDFLRSHCTIPIIILFFFLQLLLIHLYLSHPFILLIPFFVFSYDLPYTSSSLHSDRFVPFLSYSCCFLGTSSITSTSFHPTFDLDSSVTTYLYPHSFRHDFPSSLLATPLLYLASPRYSFLFCIRHASYAPSLSLLDTPTRSLILSSSYALLNPPSPSNLPRPAIPTHPISPSFSLLDHHSCA